MVPGLEADRILVLGVHHAPPTIEQCRAGQKLWLSRLESPGSPKEGGPGADVSGVSNCQETRGQTPFLDRFESAEVGYLTASGTEWIAGSEPAVKFRHQDKCRRTCRQCLPGSLPDCLQHASWRFYSLVPPFPFLSSPTAIVVPARANASG